MPNDKDHKQLVRQRSRFKCENCGKFEFAQYAHIRPESEGGEFDFNNLLFLCYPCHRKFEPTLATGKRKESRINRMKSIKNKRKIDSLVDGLFDELHKDDKLIVKLGGGITFINTPKIFEEDPAVYENPSFLDFTFIEGTLQISGLLKDENKKPIITFSGTQFALYTGDFWDIIRQPSRLEIINISRKMNVIFEQLDDLSINIEGNLYLGNYPAIVSMQDLVLKNAYLAGNIIENCGVGLGIG